MKNSRLPSAETVGRNSGRSELTVNPRFSIFMIVEVLIIFSVFSTSLPVSAEYCEKEK